jgi:hypothetical protein
MNRFGEIADEITELIEELERADLAAAGRPLKAALERAFARACESERRLRLHTEAMEGAAPGPRKRRQAAGACLDAAPERQSAVIIQLPQAWRGASPRARG